MYLSILSGLEMIQNLRDMREIDAGKIKFDKEQVELISTIDKLIRSFSQRLEIKKLNISFDHNLKQAYISGDGYYVSRILENLISNAIKFSKTYAKITVLLNANDKGYEVVVKDTGEGIKEEEEPFLFQKFKKLSTVSTGGEGSVGLGLYNAAYFANKMRASISLRRAREMGSSFVVQFVNE
jgi:signal transduction histidine kinase